MPTDLALARKAIAVFIDQTQLDAQKELDERERAAEEAMRLLLEARQVVPALFAKPGDLFYWMEDSTSVDSSSFDEEEEDNNGLCILKYVGRNVVPTSNSKHGWLIFRYAWEYNYMNRYYDGGRKLRHAMGALPARDYQWINTAEGGAQPMENTLCIPPEKCRILKEYDDYILISAEF